MEPNISSPDERAEDFDRSHAEAKSQVDTRHSFVVEARPPYEVGSLKFWAVGDRLLIEEDEFRSGYECAVCGGKGRVTCSNCKGLGTINLGGPDLQCSECGGQRERTCQACNGNGALIVTPDIVQRRPTSGRVVSAGPECKTLQEGDSVLYSNMAGYVIDLNRAGKPVTIRILHEPEVLARMSGQLTLTNMKGKSDISFPST